jgi:hypothetical protein
MLVKEERLTSSTGKLEADDTSIDHGTVQVLHSLVGSINRLQVKLVSCFRYDEPWLLYIILDKPHRLVVTIPLDDDDAFSKLCKHSVN